MMRNGNNNNYISYSIIVMCSLIWKQTLEGGQMKWIFYYLTSVYENLEKAKLKLNILGSVYFSIVNEWKFSKTLKGGKPYFTYN